MDILQRLIKNVNYNLPLYAVTVAAAFYVFTSPIIAEPILDFCFAGVVPGMRGTLSPDTMLIGDAVIIGLSILAIVVTHAFRSSADAGLVADAALELNQNLSGRMHIFSKSMTAATFDAVRYVVYALTWFAACLQFVVLRFSRVTVSTVIKITVSAIFVTRRVTSMMRLCMKRITTWLQPYAVRFDSWLEIQYRRAHAWTHKKMMRSEPARVAADIIRESKQSLRQLFK